MLSNYIVQREETSFNWWSLSVSGMHLHCRITCKRRFGSTIRRHQELMTELALDPLFDTEIERSLTCSVESVSLHLIT